MADSKVFFQAQPLIPVNNRNSITKTSNTNIKANTSSFDAILQQKINEVKFSQHAQERLNNRNIKLSANDLKKLDQAVEKISQKIKKNPLVLILESANI